MHTFLSFFSWPNGSAWSNVIAMPVCGLIAAAAAYLGRDRLGGALRPWLRRHFGHHDEIDQIKATLDVHADTLDLGTPGGLAAVMAEARRAASASEAALTEMRGLIAISGATRAESAKAAPEAAPPMPAGGPGTSGRKAPASGMGARVTPGRGGATEMRKTASAKDGSDGKT
jgi:hypothetical protein